MTVSSIDHPSCATTLPAAISNAIVRLLREYTGRGPTKARTTIRENVVLVMLEQTLTKGEKSLANEGREVVAVWSANHLDPDLGAEIYVLDEPPVPPGYGSRVRCRRRAQRRPRLSDELALVTRARAVPTPDIGRRA